MKQISNQLKSSAQVESDVALLQELALGVGWHIRFS